MKFAFGLLATVITVASASASAAPVVSDNGRVEVGVSGASGFLSDSNNFDPATGTASVSRSSNPSATYQVAASAVSLLEALPTEPGLSLSADTSVELTRAASDPSANGFAATEPGRLVRFESLGGELRLSYNLRGSSVVDNELPGNNSFARASLFVQNETTSTSIVNLQRFGPDAAGFSEQGVVTFFTQPDDIIAITLDIGSSAVIGNAETAVRVESFGSVAIDLVPEPGVGLCLAGCLLGLTRRRRTNRIR